MAGPEDEDYSEIDAEDEFRDEYLDYDDFEDDFDDPEEDDFHLSGIIDDERQMGLI